MVQKSSKQLEAGEVAQYRTGDAIGTVTAERYEFGNGERGEAAHGTRAQSGSGIGRGDGDGLGN